MKFQIKNGTELSIDLQQWNQVPNYLTNIVGETELDYRLSDQHKTEVNFPKEMLTLNAIPVINNQILLTEYIYGHFFGNLVKGRNQQVNLSIEKELLTNFAKIIAHKELVWSRAEYFLIMVDHFQCGDTMGGGFNICLGALLESWFSSDELLLQNLFPEGDLYIAQLGGSCLSGSYAGIFWSMEKNEFVYKRRQDALPLPGRLSYWIKKLRGLSALYPIKMDLNALAIQQLLKEISELENSSV